MNSTVKTIIFWVVILFSAVVLWQVVKTANSGQKVQELSSSQFLAYIDQGNIKEVTINGMEASGKEASGTSLTGTLSLIRLKGEWVQAAVDNNKHKFCTSPTARLTSSSRW